MITGVISHPVSRGGKAPQPCVLSSRCQKRALGGFHDSSFPLPEPQAAAGDTRKARGGKGRHCKSTRRKRQTPPSFGGAEPGGALTGLLLSGLFGEASRAGDADVASPSGERLGWTPRGVWGCVEVEGAVSIPPLQPPGLSPGQCWCHPRAIGHPEPAGHSGKGKH